MPPYQTTYHILPEPQQQIWGDLSPLREMGFVLYGGTALALRYGHRESVDYDFFIEKPLDKDAPAIDQVPAWSPAGRNPCLACFLEPV